MKILRSVRLTVATILFSLLIYGLAEAEDSDSVEYGLKINGELTWSATYALGDKEGLKGLTGYSINQLIAQQHVRVDANYLSDENRMVELQASFDSDKAGGFQQFQAGVGIKDWRLTVGEFTVQSENSLVMAPINIMGAKALYVNGPWTFQALLGRVEGEPVVKEFTGAEQQLNVTYEGTDSDKYSPVEKDSQIIGSIWGMLGFAFVGLYDPDFYQVSFQWQDDPGGLSLHNTLEAYGLEYLLLDPDPVIGSETLFNLETYEFSVISSHDGQHLLLRRSPYFILQRHLSDIIAQYNYQAGLVGSEAKKYPFVRGSVQETYFLETIMSYHLKVKITPLTQGGVTLMDCRMDEGTVGRFYNLGYADVVFGSVVGEIRLDGIWRSAAEVNAFSFEVFEEQGIVDVTFPPGFSYSDDALSFRYRTLSPNRVFPLGISITVGSEKVYVNGQLLMRNIQYMIDYESGVLVLVDELGPEDRIRIEYQLDKGGLGRTTIYQQNLYYLKGSLEKYGLIDLLQLDVVRLTDIQLPEEERSAIPVMPRRQTLVGLGFKAGVGKTTFNGEVAISEDVFPPYASNKPNALNRVNKILIDDGLGEKTLIFFGHNAGLTVAEWDKSTGQIQWRHFSINDGLSGMQVRDMSISSTDWWFATSRGVTRIPRGSDTLDSVELWENYTSTDGLPSDDIAGLTISDSGTIYVGTSAGLALGDSLGTWNNLLSIPVSLVAQDPLDDEVLYVVTEQSLCRLVLENERVTENTPVIENEYIRELAVNPQAVEDGVRLWAATDRGLYEIYGNGTAQLLAQSANQPITSVAWWDGEVWYSCEDKVFRLGSSQSITVDSQVSSISHAPLGSFDSWLWLGSEAFDDDLILYSVDTGFIVDQITDYSVQDSGISLFDPLIYVEPDERFVALGSAQQISASTYLGPVFLSGSYNRRDPQFLPIGRDNPEDLFSWIVMGSLPWDTGELKVQRTDAYRGYSKDGIGDIGIRWNRTNQISLSWQPSFKLTGRFSTAAEGVDDNQPKTSKTWYTEVSTGSLFSLAKLTLNHSVTAKYENDNLASKQHQTGAQLSVTPSKTSSFTASWQQKEMGKTSLDATLIYNPKWNKGNLNLRLYHNSRTTAAGSENSATRSRNGINFSAKHQAPLFHTDWTMSVTADVNAGDLYSSSKQINQQLKLSLKGTGSILKPSLSGTLRWNNTPGTEKKVLTWNWQGGLDYRLTQLWNLSFSINKEGRRVDQSLLGSLISSKDTYGVILGYTPEKNWKSTLSWRNSIQKEASGKVKITRQIKNVFNWDPTPVISCRLDILFSQEHTPGINLNSSYREITLDTELDISGSWKGELYWIWKNGSTGGDSYNTHAVKMGLKRTF
jgi:hypothetical protein